MDKERLNEYIHKQSRFDPVGIIISTLFIIVSISGFLWIGGNDQRTLFGNKINSIEEMLKTEKQIINDYAPLNEKEIKLKESCSKFSELSLGQNFMIRQLIDLGFLAFLFWNGIYFLGVCLLFIRYRKKLEKIINE